MEKTPAPCQLDVIASDDYTAENIIREGDTYFDATHSRKWLPIPADMWGNTFIEGVEYAVSRLRMYCWLMTKNRRCDNCSRRLTCMELLAEPGKARCADWTQDLAPLDTVIVCDDYRKENKAQDGDWYRSELTDVWGPILKFCHGVDVSDPEYRDRIAVPAGRYRAWVNCVHTEKSPEGENGTVIGKYRCSKKYATEECGYVAQMGLKLANRDARIKELLAVAKGYEEWEADVVKSANWENGLPTLTQDQCDLLMELQELRNVAIAKAEPEKKDKQSQ